MCWHKSVWFYFYSDSNNESYRKEHLWKSVWKAQTCLKLSQWCVFQRFSRTAGISLFRQIAVRVHQWNVDRTGSEPEHSRPTAVIKRNSLCSQSSEGGMIMWPVETCWCKKMKCVNTICDPLEVKRHKETFFFSLMTIFYFFCIICLFPLRNVQLRFHA